MKGTLAETLLGVTLLLCFAFTLGDGTWRLLALAACFGLAAVMCHARDGRSATRRPRPFPQREAERAQRERAALPTEQVGLDDRQREQGEEYGGDDEQDSTQHAVVVPIFDKRRLWSSLDEPAVMLREYVIYGFIDEPLAQRLLAQHDRRGMIAEPPAPGS